MIHFFVAGKPQPRGSKEGFPIKRRNGTYGVAMADSNKHSGEWMGRVAAAAAEAYGGDLIDEPVRLACVFQFARPKSHFGTGRNSDKLKASAPARHAQKPDLSKLVRAVEDGLTGVVWRDDSLVISYDGVGKIWTTKGEGVHVWVTPISELEAELPR